jgi:hypothetical protein
LSLRSPAAYLLGLHAPPQLSSNLRSFVAISLLTAIAAWIASAILLRYQPLWPAAISSLFVWAALGIAAGLIGIQPLPHNHIVQRLAANEIPLKVRLCWYGTLREEPVLTAWGLVFLLDLSSVDLAASQLPLVLVV